MQVVIDIDDELYERVIETVESSYDREIIANAIKNSTPLPKGHGKITDATFALKAKITKDNNGVSERTKGWNEACQAIYENAPTIIEATKESEEV